MKIAFAGPLETRALRRLANVELRGAPEHMTGIPIVPLANEMLKRGHDVTIVTLATDIDQPIRIKEGRLTVIYVPLRRRAREVASNFFETEIRALTAELRSVDCDLIHAHWTYEYAEAVVRTGRPHIVTMHDVPLDIFLIFKDLYRFVRLLMALRTLPRIKALTVVSPHMVSWVKAHGYFRKVAVVPNAIESSGEVQADDGPAWRRDGKPVLVTIGDISRRKNILNGVRAFQRVKKVYPEAELHLFGPLLTPAFIGHEPRVTVHGNVSHQELMSFLTHRATLLVHPSIQESFGLIVAEAIVRGVPVVASENAGGPAYVLGEASAGFLTDVTNPDVLAAHILRTIDNVEQSRTILRAAQRRIAEEFSTAHIVDLYVEQYRAVIRTQKRAGEPDVVREPNGPSDNSAAAAGADHAPEAPILPQRKILVSAFACDPYGGSENNMGYYFAASLANAGHHVWCMTTLRGKANIEKELARKPVPNLNFIYVEGPHWLARRYPITIFMYLYYMVWQRIAASRGRAADKLIDFDLVHHVTWESIQFGSGLWRMHKPLYFGPVGGAQFSPRVFLPSFGTEIVKEFVRWGLSRLLVVFNPDFRKTIRTANCIIVSNADTGRLAKRNGAKNVVFLPDPTLPAEFVAEPLTPARTERDKRIKLLWVGRIFKRKGLTLVLDALALVPKSVDWTLTIVGTGPNEQRIAKRIIDLGLQDRIIRKGRVEWTDIKQVYLSHDALIFTPFRESVGVQLLEAMAFGLPPIVLDLHGAALFVPVDAGIKIGVTNFEQTAQRLAAAVEMFSNLSLEARERLRHASREVAMLHIWPTKIKRIEAIYAQCS